MQQIYTPPSHSQICPHKPVWALGECHRRSGWFGEIHRMAVRKSDMSALSPLEFQWAKNQLPVAHRLCGSWQEDRTEGYRWPHSGHRPSLPRGGTLWPPSIRTKHICVAQIKKEIFPVWVQRSMSILGRVTDT
jgi:hypothetical protein